MELQEHASRDALTGLFNRRAGIQFIEDLLQQGETSLLPLFRRRE